MKILSGRILRIKASAEHSRCTKCGYFIDLHALPMNNYTTTRRTENAFEKRRLPASVSLFSLESGVALSRIVLGTTPVQQAKHQPHITPAPAELTIVTRLSFSERIAIANLS